MLVSHCGWCSIAISKSRLIFHDEDKMQTIKVANSGADAIILQAWVDGGVFTEKVDTAKPFYFVTPAVARLAPGEVRSFKVIPARAIANKKSESMFWLNLYEVDKAADTNDTALRMGVNTQLKVFYQPPSLPGKKVDAFKRLTFQIDKQKQPGELVIGNDSAYCVALASVALEQSGKLFPLPAEMDMTVLPYSRKRFHLNSASPGGMRVHYSFINDDGSVQNIVTQVTG